LRAGQQKRFGIILHGFLLAGDYLPCPVTSVEEYEDLILDQGLWKYAKHM
jgi:hypothetical protein